MTSREATEREIARLRASAHAERVDGTRAQMTAARCFAEADQLEAQAQALEATLSLPEANEARHER